MSSGLPALDRLVDEIATHPHVSRVWLFGSRARGDARRRSDIDLAVEAPDADAREWLAICGVVDEAETLIPIDLIRLDEASESLKRKIHDEGAVLYER